MKSLLGSRLQFDWKIVTVTISSTLLLMVDAYHRLTPNKGYDRTILYLLIPLALILIVFREDPREYGFTFGDWKNGLVITSIAIALIAPVLWLVAHGGGMTDYYKPQLEGLPWNTFIDLFGWEFFFRGFILFAYARKFGAEALWLQAVPFALAHIGKPEIETLSTIFGGFAFGWIAYRTRSFIYPFLVHWFVSSFTIIVAAGLLG
ncbi:MAG TPA: CPBP family intramembrane glutamic endopeptidase [Anaerolineales bacterium]|jgi:membrane protease YdiL (CAAX protease family)|nr:CPBP family intramembrane glutamic endopeptidase [Anaerolineales bacterium]